MGPKGLLLLNALLQLGDIATTTALVDKFGIQGEQNPLMKGIADKPFAMGVVKAAPLLTVNLNKSGAFTTK